MLAAVLAALVGGCGGGGGDKGNNVILIGPVVPVPQFTLGGTVSGLGPGAVVTLADGSATLPVAANGPFTFPIKRPTGTAFAITATAPDGYTCKVSDASGTIAGADSTKTTVNCAPVVLAGTVNRLQLPLALTSDANGNVYVLNRGRPFRDVPVLHGYPGHGATRRRALFAFSNILIQKLSRFIYIFISFCEYIAIWYGAARAVSAQGDGYASQTV
ncbi:MULTISPECIES: hypothetical protein [unclassified Massilia]|uniref:hypothetical protein n=1 Tax=unclassified Massilia TaxID=2609279 RepID=UPI001782AD13|nr:MULTISPECIES: hypothetical protein [unclassified Massilia]MBD8531187.1 hypothetical protein [Massilia sp. CFBP 13647]MBD8675023.1 hypothetical protein [Massilia sp. CFBP 13721]